MRKVVGILAPITVILAAWVLAAKAESFSDVTQTLITVIPYVIALLAVFMSIWYQNSNSFYLVCFILVSYIFISVSQKHLPMLVEAVTMLSILFPVNTIWLSFSKERGILSTYGRNKALIIAAQLIWVFINIRIKSNVPLDQGIEQVYIGIKVPALILYILAVGILLSCYILRNRYMDLIYVAVLISSIIAFYLSNRIVLASIFISAIFVIMVIAMFDVSYSLAFYDTLTGVLSRRALEQELLKLGDRKYIIAMVDLDYFKKINDSYGHDIGDEVLKMVASVLNKTLQKAKVFRYGGEEFVVLFVGRGYNEVMKQLELVRRTIEKRPFIIRSDNRPVKKPDEPAKYSKSKGKGKINITVSIGLAQKTDSLKTSYDVIKKADEALYKSKQSGRNCITSA
ncbi:MAG: GGDEF domain-containing protein [Clostridiaceae bacterium]|nr:GGDEF domain-containing protein [Clostridiaceae bacterium]